MITTSAMTVTLSANCRKPWTSWLVVSYYTRRKGRGAKSLSKVSERCSWKKKSKVTITVWYLHAKQGCYINRQRCRQGCSEWRGAGNRQQRFLQTLVPWSTNRQYKTYRQNLALNLTLVKVAAKTKCVHAAQISWSVGRKEANNVKLFLTNSILSN